MLTLYPIKIILGFLEVKTAIQKGSPKTLSH